MLSSYAASAGERYGHGDMENEVRGHRTHSPHMAILQRLGEVRRSDGAGQLEDAMGRHGSHKGIRASNKSRYNPSRGPLECVYAKLRYQHPQPGRG